MNIFAKSINIASGKIIVGGYENGRLVSLSVKNYSSDNETFELNGDIDTVKVMAWDGFDSLKPLTEAEVIPKTEWIVE